MKAEVKIVFDTTSNNYAEFRDLVDKFLDEVEKKKLQGEEITVKIFPKPEDKTLLLE